MELTLYSFSKRHNSTLIPDSEGVQFDVKLKDNVSINQPIFILNMVNTDYNYAYWNGLYYFIDDIVILSNTLEEIHCSVDVLASFRSDIFGATALIDYATVGDARLIDQRLPVLPTPTISRTVGDTIFTASGTYIVCVTGKDDVGVFAVTGEDNLKQLVYTKDDVMPITPSQYVYPSLQEQILYSTIDIFQCLKNLAQNLVGMGHIQENIRSCIWVPFSPQGISASSRIWIGQYLSDCVGRRINNLSYKITKSINIPWQFSDWRNASPYTDVYLYLPFVGVQHIPSSNVVGQTSLSLEIEINQASGDISYGVKCGNAVIGVYSSNMSVSIAIGSSNISPKNMMTSLVAGTKAVLSKDISGVAEATLGALEPLITNIGGYGGLESGGAGLSPICFTICHNTSVAVGSYATVQGIPYNAVDVISNHAGYVKTIGASVSGTMDDYQRATINSMLDGGVFIE